MKANKIQTEQQANDSSLEELLQDSSFCLFRLPEQGGRIIWEITNSCNYSCSYCIFSAENGEVYDEPDTEDVYQTLDGLKEKGFTHLKFTGGEPFLRKDFVDILKYSAELGFEIDVSTNASLINAEKAQEIGDLELKMVHVSYDGHNKEIHESVRGKNTYKHTVRGIKHLVDNDVYVRLGTVIFKGNENYLEETVQSAVELGVNEIIFSYMEPVGRMKDDNSIISQTPVEDLKYQLENLAEKYADQVKVNYSFTEEVKSCEEGLCPAVKKFLYIDNLGRISPCTWVVEHDPKYRSEQTIKDANVDEILDSEPIKNYLAHVKDLHANGQKGCPYKTR